MGAFIPKEEAESRSPVVLFLGRVDPYKRPWLLVPLARMFPHVTFIVAGQSHFHGQGSYRLPRLGNLQTVGLANSTVKHSLLRKAWLLISLSVHEGVAVSFLEALACATPIVALVDPGELISSYGCFAGAFPGTGMAAIGSLGRCISWLLQNQSARRELGIRGREHVIATHNEQRFLTGFATLLKRLHVPKEATFFPCSSQDRKAEERRSLLLWAEYRSFSRMNYWSPDRRRSVVRAVHLAVSIVIPSMNRQRLLPALLVGILKSTDFTSLEIIIAHASEESLAAEAWISKQVASRCIQCDMRNISHIDMVELNSHIGCTMRHFAALQARNAIVVHLDDDLIPSTGLLSQLANRVARGGVALVGPFRRKCGARGYCFAPGQPDVGLPVGCRARSRCNESDASVVLTKFAAMPYQINRWFVQKFEQGERPYRELMNLTKGNGCDLIFNIFLHQENLGRNISWLNASPQQARTMYRHSASYTELSPARSGYSALYDH